MIIPVGRGSGLSLTKPLIHVNAKLGSTVTFSYGGVIVKTIAPAKAFANADGVTADYYFSATQTGSWTVTATLNSLSASQSVSVSAIKQYDVKLIYELVLFESGTWASAAGTISSRNYAIESGEIKLTTNASSTSCFCTGSKVGMSSYTKLRATYKCKAKSGSSLYFGASSGTSTPTPFSDWGASLFDSYTSETLVADSTYKTIEVNVSAITSDYVKMGAYATIYVKKIWLE